jgi:two-component system, OmpR family, alkaline phosphatase synthesis response regulator PhoP
MDGEPAGPAGRNRGAGKSEALYTCASRTWAAEVKILLVDDSKFLRRACEHALARAGYQVITADDGAAALAIAQDQIPSLVVLDMMLPKLSGLEVLRALKQNVATKDIPVIVLTSLSERNSAKLLEEGATSFVEKSDSLLDKDGAVLIQAVARVVGKAATPKS